MEQKTFTVRMPAELTDQLDAEAQRKYFKSNGRNQLLIEILASRYKKPEFANSQDSELEQQNQPLANAA